MHSSHCCRWGATPLQDAYLVHDKVMYAMLERAGAKMSDDGAIEAKLHNQTVSVSNQNPAILWKHEPTQGCACLPVYKAACGWLSIPCSNFRRGQLALQPERGRVHGVLKRQTRASCSSPCVQSS